MDKRFKSMLSLLLSTVLMLSVFTACSRAEDTGGVNDAPMTSTESSSEIVEVPEGYSPLTPDMKEEDIPEDAIFWGEDYIDPISVSAYIFEWHELPPNYITKAEAKEMGWISSEGNLHEVAPWASIGGDKFGNREGILPEDEEYRECDVNYEGGYRGAERLVYSIDDYDIYYTDDHYETFSQMYDSEEGYIWED